MHDSPECARVISLCALNRNKMLKYSKQTYLLRNDTNEYGIIFIMPWSVVCLFAIRFRPLQLPQKSAPSTQWKWTIYLGHFRMSCCCYSLFTYGSDGERWTSDHVCEQRKKPHEDNQPRRRQRWCHSEIWMLPMACHMPWLQPIPSTVQYSYKRALHSEYIQCISPIRLNLNSDLRACDVHLPFRYQRLMQNILMEMVVTFILFLS